MIIEAGPALFPFGVLEGLCGQGFKRRAVYIGIWWILVMLNAKNALVTFLLAISVLFSGAAAAHSKPPSSI